MPASKMKQTLLYPIQAARQLVCALLRPANRGASSSWTLEMTAILLLLPFVLLILHLWDADIIRAASQSNNILMQFLRAVTDAIRTIVWLPIAAVVWLATAFLLSSSSQIRDALMRFHGWATLVLVSIVVGGIPVEIGKFVIGRARPPLLDTVGAAYFLPFKGQFLYESFPSGHSMMAGIMMISLCIFLPRWRVLIAPVCVLFCVSRLAAGLHYPTDVLAGFTIGFVACWWVARYMATRNIIFLIERGRTLPVI